MPEKIKGSLALVLLTLLYGTLGIYSRLIGQSFGVFSQQGIRNFLVVILVLVIAFLFRVRFKPVRKSDRGWLIAWVFSGSFDMILFFIAFNHLPIGLVYFLAYSTMIVSGVLCGKIFFGERLKAINIASVVLAFCGLATMYSIVIDSRHFLPVIYSLLGGAILGFWNTISKKFSNNYPEIQLALFDGFASGLVGFVGFLVVHETLPVMTLSSGWFWMIVYALSQVASVSLLVYGFKHVEAQVGSVILPAEIIFATLFAFLIFGEKLTLISIIGGSLIVVAAFLPTIQPLADYLKQKKEVR